VISKIKLSDFSKDPSVGFSTSSHHSSLIFLITFFLGSVVSIYHWSSLVQRQDKQLHEVAQKYNMVLVHQIEAQLVSYSQRLTIIANRWSIYGMPAQGDWEADVRETLPSLPGLAAMGWVDKDFHLRWGEPRSVTRPLLGSNLCVEQRSCRAAREARQSHRLTTTETMDFIGTGKGFLAFAPIFRNDSFDGFIMAVFHFERFINSIAADRIFQDYGLAISVSQETVYARFPKERPKQLEVVTAVIEPFPRMKWSISTWPTANVIIPLQSARPIVALAMGILLSFLIAGLAYFLTILLTQRRLLRDAGTSMEREIHLKTKALRESEERLRFALDAIQAGEWEYNLTDNTSYRSLQHSRIFGYDPPLPEWNFSLFLQHVLPEDRDLVNSRVSQAAASGSNLDYECRIMRADGQTRWIRTAGRFYRDDEGNVKRLIGIVEDITERKQIAQQLVIAKEEAEAANLAKSRFLASMSHDLRTPLNAVIGFSELSLFDSTEGSLSQRHKDYIKLIADAGYHLLHLVEGLLSISAIEIGKIKLNKEKTDLKLMIQDICKTYELFASKGGIKFLTDLQITQDVWCDKHRIVEVLNNLVNNAIKFTAAGGSITLSAHEDEKEVTIFVKDTGIGIEQEHFEKIFKPFEQIKSASSGKNVKSVGLGLAISRQLVELHGGKMGVESKIGEGSCFYFTLPLG
jgi:PAS domain S-box-containing protein